MVSKRHFATCFSRNRPFPQTTPPINTYSSPLYYSVSSFPLVCAQKERNRNNIIFLGNSHSISQNFNQFSRFFGEIFEIFSMSIVRSVRSGYRFLGAQRTFYRGTTASSWKIAQDICNNEEGFGSGYSSAASSRLRWFSSLTLASALVFIQSSEAENSGYEAVEDQQPSPRRAGVGHKHHYILSESYRRRIFFNYEKRLRLRSTPEKVFEYFASVTNDKGEQFMTSADLMRAVVPVFPPSNSHVVREGSLRGEEFLRDDPLPGQLYCEASKLFKLFDINEDGYISFPEYIFFITLLSIPEKDVLANFRKFDVDNDGKIDKSEFKNVMAMMRSSNRQGSSHRDGLRTGLKVSGRVDNGGLINYFFGSDGNDNICIEQFEKFLKALHEEITRLEFDHYACQSEKMITATDFALSMVAAADMGQINRYLDKVDELSKNPSLSNIRITYEEFCNFVELRKKLHSFSLAISSYGEAYGFLSKTNFQQAAAHVCSVPISDNIADIIFFIFDINGDGKLSTDEFLSVEEFLSVLERREGDIRCPKDSGIVYYFKHWWDCAKACGSSWLYS